MNTPQGPIGAHPKPHAFRETPPNPDLGMRLGGLQRLIYDRYFPTDSARGIPGTFLLLMEEVGELATALHNNREDKTPSPAERANLEEEFADVLAWLTTLANITGVDLSACMDKYVDPDRVQGVKD